MIEMALLYIVGSILRKLQLKELGNVTEKP